jgi:hypothetical protein
MATIARLPIRHTPPATLCRREIGDLIEMLIDLLDATGSDPDLEDDETEDDDPPGEEAAI